MKWQLTTSWDKRAFNQLRIPNYSQIEWEQKQYLENNVLSIQWWRVQDLLDKYLHQDIETGDRNTNKTQEEKNNNILRDYSILSRT